MANKKLKNFEYANHSEKEKSQQINSDEISFFECVNGFVFLICDGNIIEDTITKPSLLAAERIKYYLENEFVEKPSEAIYNALVYANGFIFEYARKNPDFNNPRVSCSILLFRDNECYYCTIGNSSIYFFNGRKVYTIARGDLETSAVKDAGDETVNGNFLGQKQNIEPYINPEPLNAINDDIIVLCSNGFYEVINEKSMLKILSDPMPVQTKVYRLIDTAMLAGAEDSVSIQLISFYNLDNKNRQFYPLQVKGKKIIKTEKPLKKDKPNESEEEKGIKTSSNPILEKLEQPAVKYTLIALVVLLLTYMFYDMFLFNPVPQQRIEITAPAEAADEDFIDDESATESPEYLIPQDRIYQVRSGDNWSRIYNQFGVCSWFIRNHPPNRGRFDSEENPIAGTQISIPLLYSSREELNPDFYQDFSLEKTGVRCENANQAFLNDFREKRLN
ncbi:MAG: hypothetical protein EA393_05215 [Bacteroidetes bacterium]|nr:MAG: hypothetical protein EA393_05215 [Bacteroidota bacterium]